MNHNIDYREPKNEYLNTLVSGTEGMGPEIRHSSSDTLVTSTICYFFLAVKRHAIL
jgi:hypothetical protein